MLIDAVDEQVAGIYKTIRISAGQRQRIEKHLLAELDRIYVQQATASKNLASQREKLKTEQAKLLQAHYADAIPLELMKQEQQRITRQISAIDKEIAGYTANRQQVEDHLAQALDLLEDCHKLYQHAPAHLKKMLNNVFFERVLINPPETSGIDGARRIAMDEGELAINGGLAVLNNDALVNTSKLLDKGTGSVCGDDDTDTNSPLLGRTNSADVQAVPHIHPPCNTLSNPVLRAEIFNHPNHLPKTPDTTKQKSPPEKHHSGEGSDMRVMVGPPGLEPGTCGLKVRSSTS